MNNKTNSIHHLVSKTVYLGLTALTLSFSVTLSHASEYYRWTDANGVVHMTDKKPDNHDVEVIKSRTHTPRPRLLSEQKKDAEDAAAAKAEAEALAAKKAAAKAVDLSAPKKLRCQQERERLSILQSNNVVHMQDANGDLKTLTEAQIKKEIITTEKAISALCAE